MSITLSYRISSLLIVLTVSAIGLALTFVPRWHDQVAQLEFIEESISSSYVRRFPRTWLDSIASSPGLVKTVTLQGSWDSNIKLQVQSLASFPKLRELTAFSVDEVFVPNRAQKLDRLEVASFSYCSAAFVESIIAVSPSLREIEFYECLDLEDHHVFGLVECKLLRRISIDGTAITGTFLQEFSETGKLEELKIRYSPLDQAGIDAIGNCRSLRVISLWSSDQPVSLEPLSRLSNLDSLDLVWFEENGEEIQKLMNQANLKLQGSE
jgi:hypothetical protein